MTLIRIPRGNVLYAASLSFAMFMSHVGIGHAEDSSCQGLVSDLREWLGKNSESSPFRYRVSFTYSYLDGAYPHFYTGFMEKDDSSDGLISVGSISRVKFPDGTDYFGEPEKYLSIKVLANQGVVNTRVTGYWTNPRAISEYEFSMHCLHNKIMYLGEPRANDQSLSFEKIREG